MIKKYYAMTKKQLFNTSCFFTFWRTNKSNWYWTQTAIKFYLHNSCNKGTCYHSQVIRNIFSKLVYSIFNTILIRYYLWAGSLMIRGLYSDTKGSLFESAHWVSSVVSRLLSKCLWSGWKWWWGAKEIPSPIFKYLYLFKIVGNLSKFENSDQRDRSCIHNLNPKKFHVFW